MTKREQMLHELAGENDYGVLLMVQMDSVPDTIQCVVATTTHDEAAGGLRDKHRYVVRAIGVQEHNVAVGMFKSARVLDDHPLLHQYNTPPVGLFFRGTPDDANELVLDIFQGYASTFGPWRQIPTYLNLTRPLIEMVQGGGDLIGQMPRPLADTLAKAFEHHGCETKITEDKREGPDYKVLLLDDSYIVAMDFAVDLLGQT